MCSPHLPVVWDFPSRELCPFLFTYYLADHVFLSIWTQRYLIYSLALIHNHVANFLWPKSFQPGHGHSSSGLSPRPNVSAWTSPTCRHSGRPRAHFACPGLVLVPEPAVSPRRPPLWALGVPGASGRHLPRALSRQGRDTHCGWAHRPGDVSVCVRPCLGDQRHLTCARAPHRPWHPTARSGPSCSPVTSTHGERPSSRLRVHHGGSRPPHSSVAGQPGPGDQVPASAGVPIPSSSLSASAVPATLQTRREGLEIPLTTTGEGVETRAEVT